MIVLAAGLGRLGDRLLEPVVELAALLDAGELVQVLCCCYVCVCFLVVVCCLLFVVCFLFVVSYCFVCAGPLSKGNSWGPKDV